MKLTDHKCADCEGGMPPLNEAEATVLLRQVPGWELAADAQSISRDYSFKNFNGALAFVNRVGALAETEGHHPDLHLTDYRHVRIVLTTHAVGGLSNNDFIMAAKIDIE